MKNNVYLHLISKPFSSKALSYNRLAGLLTYPHFDWPSHTCVQWQKLLSKCCIGFTVAGLFRICT